MILPPGKPVISNLNSYYLDMGKLIEHYQGELNSGSIYLKSYPAEGLIFFDEHSITNVFYEDKNSCLDGKIARDRLIRALGEYNFGICVYRIEPDKLHYWACLSYAENLYMNLSAEFTALEGLIKRMSAERLTGYIDTSFTGEGEGGLVFFNNGNIIATSCSWDKEGSNGLKKNLHRLVSKAKSSGGTFNVKRIDLNRTPGEASPGGETRRIPDRVLVMLMDLLATLEFLVTGEKRIKNDFDTLLKKKFFEKADTYEFLDPFAAELRYTSGLFQFVGDAPPEQLVRGVSESVKELAGELGLLALLRNHLETWKKKYRSEILKYEIEL